MIEVAEVIGISQGLERREYQLFCYKRHIQQSALAKLCSTCSLSALYICLDLHAQQQMPQHCQHNLYFPYSCETSKISAQI